MFSNFTKITNYNLLKLFEKNGQLKICCLQNKDLAKTIFYTTLLSYELKFQGNSESP